MIGFPKLYTITDKRLSHCSHSDTVSLMLAGGARLIQLRDKEASPEELKEAAEACLKLTHTAGAKLIINDNVETVVETGADGVHLGQTDMPVEDARKLLGRKYIIGTSTHNLVQVTKALETSADYIAVGPVFTTSTKENPDPVVGLEIIRQAKLLSDRPIVAIGGIDQSNARSVMDAGADTIAVISALYSFNSGEIPDISGNVRSLFEALDTGS